MSDAVIAIDGLVKDYHGIRPLRMQQLRVDRGARVALSGLDATAAEVFVNLVNGAILPDAGEVRVFGRATTSIVNESEWFAWLDRFGIVTHRAVLLEASTVEQNLALPFTIDIDHLAPEQREVTARLANEVELDAGWLPQGVHAAPAAARMRIHLARALAVDPEVLLLEHPTGAMTREEVDAFAEVVARVADARVLTVLAISEDVAFATRVAGAHYRLQGGSGALVNARGWRRFLA